MAQVEEMKAQLENRRTQMGKIAFDNSIGRLSKETKYVFFMVLGGNSFDEIVEAIARRDFHSGSESTRPSDGELAAAEVEVEYHLSKIEGRFQLPTPSKCE